MNLFFLAVTSLSGVVVAWIYNQRKLLFQQQQQQHAVYVIGDTHGDVECTKQWVKRTGLIIENEKKNNRQLLEWTDPTSYLVFMGDYIDKGIYSRQTIEYVKSLTEQFPHHVVALLGNHELELLRDRTTKRWDNGNAGFYQLAYATVHPAEYLNYLPYETPTNDDLMAVEALYNASVEVYGRGLHQSVYTVPDYPPANTKLNNNNKKESSILHYVPPNLREKVRDKLEVFQMNYLNTYRTGTELGTWLESRPIGKILGETLFVHGGLSPQVAQNAPLRTPDDLERLNAAFAQHATESKLESFLQNTLDGQAVYSLLIYRGNHVGEEEETHHQKNVNACMWLPQILPEPVVRLAVGHTPGNGVRSSCQDKFWALDSALSRWFRNSGNEYCPGDRVVEYYHDHSHRTAANRSHQPAFRCHKKLDQCLGQIVRILPQQNEVEILSAN